MNKIVFCLIIGIMAAVTASVYSDSVAADIASGVVRLHIIANSDSEEDQAAKLAVRDAIIGAQRRGEIDSLSDAADIAGEVLADRGCTYSAIVTRGRYYFPTKEYKNVRMPAGMYDAVRVILGAGGGRNWWCVMYPPLCFTEECAGELSADGEEILRGSVSDESADVITGSGAEIEMKFKLVELVQKAKEKYFS